jgi:photosystem II stability/assembly factor-like uncharacterized protein
MKFTKRIAHYAVAMVLITCAICINSTTCRTQSEFVNNIKVVSETLSTRENLIQVCFFNKEVGWIFSETNIYKTENGGNTWSRIPFKIKEKEVVSTCQFINRKIGWIVVQRNADYSDDTQYFKVLKTTNGGKSWTSKRFEQNAVVSGMTFDKTETGWIAGYHKNGMSSNGVKYLLTKTTDGGRNWRDRSNAIVDTIADLRSNSPNEKVYKETIVGIIKSSSSRLVVFLGNGIVLHTLDGGETWQRFETPNEKLSPFVKAGVMELGSIWILRGQFGIHGLFSEVILQENHKNFVKSRLPRGYFTDFVDFSENQFIVIGTVDTELFNKQRVVILSSFDFGRTWQSIYEDLATSRTNSVSRASERNVWAVGTNGTLYHLFDPSIR